MKLSDTQQKTLDLLYDYGPKSKRVIGEQLGYHTSIARKSGSSIVKGLCRKNLIRNCISDSYSKGSKFELTKNGEKIIKNQRSGI